VGTGGMGYTFTALPALLLLAGCFGIPASTDSPAAVGAPANVIAVRTCNESGADAKDPKAREAACLKELGKQASRKGNVLSLKLDDGTAKTFRTETAGCNGDGPKKCEEYRLVGFYPLPGAYLLLSQGFEIYGFKTVNIHTGETKEFDGVPRLAPDNATFFVKSCHDGCTISIETMASAAPPVWQTSSPDADAEWEFVRWIDNDQVGLRISGKSPHCEQGDCEAILKRSGDSWSVEKLPAKSAAR
jgi:hypothetical protein